MRKVYCFCKSIGFRSLPVFIAICISGTINPFKIEATPLDGSKNDEFSYEQLGNSPYEKDFKRESHELFDQYSVMSFLGKKTPSIGDLLNLFQNGNYNNVLKKIETLPKEEKNTSDVISLKAATLAGKGNFTLAMQEYDKLKVRGGASSQHFSRIANMLLTKKKPFLAMMACQSGLMRDAQSARLLYQMGFAYNMMGKTATALTYYQGALSANGLSNELKQKHELDKAIAVTYYKLNDFEKAKNALKDNNFKNNGSGIQLIINAKYYISKGEHDKAIALLDKAQHSSRSLEADLIKAQFLILNSQPDNAIKLLNDLGGSRGSSGNVVILLKLTKSLALLTGGRPEQALVLLENLEHPEKVQHLHMLKAITYFSMNKKKKAIDELKQTSLPYSELAGRTDFEQQLNQPSIGSDIGLAFFCFDQKFYNQAIMIAEKAKEKTQDNILLNFILAECYLGTGQFALAINELLVINNVFKESYALRFYLSQAYTKAGMMEEASETYMLLTEDRPDFVMADLVYGKILADFSKWEEAKKVYENGLNYMPYSGDLQTSLGWVLLHLDELENFENLLTIIEKNKNIALVSVLHLKGWAAFKRNDYLKAEEFLMQAIEQAPGDPEICYHLGMVMLAIGKKETARNLLRQSMLFEKQRNKYKDETKKAFL